VYKTAVYTLVNVGITHQNSKYQKRVILLSSTFTLQCTAEQYQLRSLDSVRG